MKIARPWFSRLSLLASAAVVGTVCVVPAAIGQTASPAPSPVVTGSAPDSASSDSATNSDSATLALPEAPASVDGSVAAAPAVPSVPSNFFTTQAGDDQKTDQGTYQEGQQTKRILFIIPNFRSVSVDAKLKPLTPKEKFGLAFSDSFDYSSFIYVGMLAGVGMAENATPEFHQGAAGYGRYYWHSFADNTIGNFMTEAIVPIATREDPRYYTLGRGGLFKRSYYAVSRLLITRTDADPDKNTFNFSEVVGNGAASGIAYFYYPSQERNWTKVGQRWLLQIGLDGMSNVVKEFWPDVAHGLFHQKKVAPEGAKTPASAAPPASTPAPPAQQ